MAVEKTYLKPAEAARYLGLSVRTLCRYRSSGEGPAFHLFGCRVRYLRADLDGWAALRRPAAAGDGATGRETSRRRDGAEELDDGGDGPDAGETGLLPALLEGGHPVEGGHPGLSGRDAQDAAGRRILNARDAAAYVGCSPDALKGLRGRGEGPRWSKERRRVVYDVRDLDAWVEGRMRRFPAGAAA